MSRVNSKFAIHNRPGAHRLVGRITLDSGGVPSIDDFPGVASVSRTNTGEYKITLDDPAFECYHANFTEDESASGVVQSGLFVRLRDSDHAEVAASGHISFHSRTAAGTLQDLADRDMTIELYVKKCKIS